MGARGGVGAERGAGGGAARRITDGNADRLPSETPPGVNPPPVLPAPRAFGHRFHHFHQPVGIVGVVRLHGIDEAAPAA